MLMNVDEEREIQSVEFQMPDTDTDVAQNHYIKKYVDGVSREKKKNKRKMQDPTDPIKSTKYTQQDNKQS